MSAHSQDGLPSAVVLGAGIGLLAAQVVHADVGLALLAGAVIGAAWVTLLAWIGTR